MIEKILWLVALLNNKLKHLLKKIGSWIGTVKKYISTIQQEVSNLDNEKIDADSNEVKTENKTNDKK